MLKVFIADDEYYFRQALKATIDWPKHGFIICGEAKDGEETLKQIKELMPDVVLLDINMPMMNGLDVMQVIREAGIECKVIIISGHDEFNYALQAIQLGVHNYILKPVDKDKLITALEEIKEIFEQKRNISVEMDQLKERVSRNLPQLRDQMLISLLYGSNTFDRDALIEKMVHLDIDLIACKVMVAVVEVDYDQSEAWEEQDKTLWLQAVADIVEKVILDKFHGAVCHDNSGKICILLGFETLDNEIYAKVIPKLYQIKEAVEEHLDFTVTIGVGDIYDNVEDIKHSYNEAINALSNRIIVGSNQIIPFNTVSDGKLSVVYYTPEYRQQLLIALRLNDCEQCLMILEHLFQDMRISCTSPELLRITCIGVVSTCLEYVSEIKMEQGIGLDLASIFKEIQVIHKIEEMETFIKEIFVSVIEAVKRNKKATSSKFVEKALTYIQQNYMNSELSLKEIAENVYVNYGHLCYLFKRETGMTMNEYITEYRMNKAKELMLGGIGYVVDVANLVGFVNANYFGKCFKKHFGVSPSAFIEQKKG